VLDEDTDNRLNPIILWMLDPLPGPDQIVETDETRQLVWEALEQLSPEQRAAIVMRHFLEENLSKAMACQLCGFVAAQYTGSTTSTNLGMVGGETRCDCHAAYLISRSI